MNQPRRRRLVRGVSLWVDALEARQLMHASVNLTWAFSPTNPSTTKEIADHGGVYKKYGNYTFGWAASERDETRTRNLISNKTLDSFIHVRNKWEAALPNGQYRVTLTSGDAKFFDSTHVIDVEGVRVMNGTVSASKPFRTQSGVVTVKDGRLTLRPGSMGVNTKLNSIKVESVEEDEPSTVTIKTIRGTAIEQPTSSTQNGLVRVVRSGGHVDAAQVVNLAWSGSAGGRDIVSRPATVTIPAGKTTVDLLIVAKTDSVTEKAETAVVTLVGNSNYRIGSPASASIRVENTEPEPVEKPSVTIAASDDLAIEGSSNGAFTLTRAGNDLSGPLSVALTWSGSAGSNDVEARPGSVMFAAGSSTVVVTVEATDDALIEPDETATLTIASGGTYTVGSPSSADVTVRSNDVEPPPARNTLTWTTGTSSPTVATEGMTAVVGDIFYRFGGYRDSSFVPSRAGEKYNLATNSWTSIASMPVGFSHAGTAVVGTKVWLVGAYEERVGFAGQQNIGTTRVLIYDTVANTWSDGPALPEARGSGGLALINNKLYFTSGERLSDRQEMSTTWMLDLANQGDGWQTRAAMPSPRSHFGVAVVDDILYVLGGQTGHDNAGVPLKTVYAYDPSTNTWTQKADTLYARSHQAPATFAFEGKIYSFGGDNPANQPNAHVTEYDPATGTSRALANLPANRMAGSAEVVDGKFIFSGGYDYDFRATTWIGTWS